MTEPEGIGDGKEKRKSGAAAAVQKPGSLTSWSVIIKAHRSCALVGRP